MQIYKEQYYLTIIVGILIFLPLIIVGTPIPEWINTLMYVSGIAWFVGMITIQILKNINR